MMAIILLGATPRQSFAGPTWFLLGYAVGNSGNNRTSEQAYTDSTILYTLPNLAERVKNPLEIHLSATHKMFFANEKFLSESENAFNKTIYQLFLQTVPSADKNELLQVIKVIDEKDQNAATIWFAYIEKDKVLPLAAKPEQSKKPIK